MKNMVDILKELYPDKNLPDLDYSNGENVWVYRIEVPDFEYEDDYWYYYAENEQWWQAASLEEAEKKLLEVPEGRIHRVNVKMNNPPPEYERSNEPLWHEKLLAR